MTESEDPLQRAVSLAYRHLNRREHTESELRARLERASVDSSTSERALSILREQAVVDDARFARLFVEDKRTLDQWGSERIRRALLQRGLERDLIEQALRQDSGADELDRAIALVRSRFATAPQERRERDRALGMLLRKGYDSEVALDALAAYARDGVEAGTGAPTRDGAETGTGVSHVR